MPDTYVSPPIPDNVKTLLDAGAAHARTVITEAGCAPVVIIPQGYKAEALTLPPEKIERSIGFADVESFAAYVNKFIQPGTLLLATVSDTDCKIVAHIDHHDQAVLEGSSRTRKWSSHIATLVCVQTREWKTWIGHNGEANKFSQVEFAQFLEDNERVFRSPDAAGLLELVLTLQGKSNVRFNAAHRLQSGGAKLDYEEDVELKGGVGTGQIDIPTELTCAIVPFENGPQPYAVRSRLRYRIASRQIVFWYETITPHLTLRDAAKAVMDSVREKVKAPLLIGG